MTYPYETATEEQRKVGAWWLCVHHEIHCEPLIEPVEARVHYIRESKPEHEIDARLRELRPVLHPERLPARLCKAGAEYDKAAAEYDKAKDEYDKALAECDKAVAEYDKAKDEYVKELYFKAQAEYFKAWAECDKAWAEYAKALAEYAKALAEYEAELMALHREEYPDTKWNGKSIFSEGKP